MQTTHFNFKISFAFKIGLIFAAIFFLTFFYFQNFSLKVTPKLVHIAQISIEKYVYHTTSDFKLLALEKNYSDKFLSVKENKDGEIISIDYDMAKIYQLAENLTNSLEENITNAYELNIYINKNQKFRDVHDGLLLSLPIGVVSDSVFLSNLGPKIPVLIRFINSVFSSVKTRVTDYGINNVLMEIYLDVTINYEILTPVTMEEKRLKYELLLDSKVIQGQVPNLYGGIMESRSAFFEVPFRQKL